MKTIIAANDSALAARLSLALQRIGVECPPSHQVSLDSAPEIVKPSSTSTVLFFTCSQFSASDFSLMKQVATAGNHIKLVAVGPANSSSLVLQAIHNGALDFVDLGADIEVELRNLFGRLKACGNELPAAGQLFVVLPIAGGAGASSLAVNLAAAIALKQSTCCLLDLCLRGGSLATLLKVKPRYTLLSLAEKAQQLDRAMFDQSLVNHECGIQFLASPEPFSNFRQVTSQLIQQNVQCLARARKFASVVAELEDMEHDEQVRTLAQADRVIIPLRLDFVALARAKACIERLSSSIPRNRIVLVACCEGQPNELPAKRFAEVLGMPVEHRIRYDPSAMNASVNLGMPLVAASPRSKATQGIVRLADAMTGAAEQKQVRANGLGSKSVAAWLGLSRFLSEIPHRTTS